MPATREQRSHRHIVSPRRTAQRLEQRTTQRGSSTRRGLQFLRIDGTKAHRRRPLSERAGCTGGARSPAGPPELRGIRTGIQYRMPILQDNSGGRRRGSRTSRLARLHAARRDLRLTELSTNQREEADALNEDVATRMFIVTDTRRKG